MNTEKLGQLSGSAVAGGLSMVMTLIICAAAVAFVQWDLQAFDRLDDPMVMRIGALLWVVLTAVFYFFAWSADGQE